MAGSWISSKWRMRAPDGRVLLRTFIGGARDPRALDRSDEELIAASLREMGALLGIRGAPVFTRLHRWERANAQHDVGHLDLVAAIDRRLAQPPRALRHRVRFPRRGRPRLRGRRPRHRRPGGRLALFDGSPTMSPTMRLHPSLSPVLASGILLALAACAAPGDRAMAQAQPPAARAQATSGQVPAELQKLLGQIKQVDTGQLAVSEEDGRMLRVLAASTKAKRALEIGSASGYSAIWIGLGLRETGGRLVTIEYDPVRAKEAAENVRRAGLADIVQVVHGDAFKEIPKLPGTFDFVFLDAWKRDYKRFLDMMLPRLDAGGLFLAHNVVNKGGDMPDFLEAIEQNPNLFTAIVTPSGEGISISMKRR